MNYTFGWIFQDFPSNVLSIFFMTIKYQWDFVMIKTCVQARNLTQQSKLQTQLHVFESIILSVQCESCL